MAGGVVGAREVFACSRRLESCFGPCRVMHELSFHVSFVTLSWLHFSWAVLLASDSKTACNSKSVCLC
jgi:hypothetical protein